MRTTVAYDKGDFLRFIDRLIEEKIATRESACYRPGANHTVSRGC